MKRENYHKAARLYQAIATIDEALENYTKCSLGSCPVRVGDVGDLQPEFHVRLPIRIINKMLGVALEDLLVEVGELEGEG